MQRVDADRRCGRPRTSSTGTQSSRRYVGATPLTRFHAITADLKVTCCRTGSQWRLRSIGETWSRHRAPDTRRATAFWTAWMESSDLIVEHPLSTITGLCATDGADTCKIGRQLPLAPAWTADCQAPRGDLWQSNQTQRLMTSGGVESKWAWQAAAECPARLAESCRCSISISLWWWW